MHEPIPTTFWIFWMLAFLGFPIGGLAATTRVGPVTDPGKGTQAGIVTGFFIGILQWFALHIVFSSLQIYWILATMMSMGFGLGLSIQLFGDAMDDDFLIWRALLTGLCIGIGQWLVLRGVLPNAAAWILVISLAWPLGWFITRRIGVDLKPKWSVFGAAGRSRFKSSRV